MEEMEALGLLHAFLPKCQIDPHNIEHSVKKFPLVGSQRQRHATCLHPMPSCSRGLGDHGQEEADFRFHQPEPVPGKDGPHWTYALHHPQRPLANLRVDSQAF